MNITTINNPSGLISDVGRPNMQEWVAAGAHARFEPNDQLSQVFGQQPDDRPIQHGSV